VASEAARARRQRELELEVLTGTVRGWEGEPIDQVIINGLQWMHPDILPNNFKFCESFVTKFRLNFAKF
jgi:hypothetical protein